MKEKNRSEFLPEAKRTLIGILGAFIYAIGVNFFIVPAKLYTGGLMGISQVIRTMLIEYTPMTPPDFDIAGLIFYAFNIPIFILAVTRIGKRFFLKTLLVVTAMTVFLALLPVTPMLSDRVAAAVVGGILTGTALGLILRMGASSGGMDVVGVLLSKWKRDFSVGKIGLFVNIGLYTFCLFLFNREIVIYSLMYAAVTAVAMDRAHFQNINVEVTIITKVHTELLEEEVFEELGRGITKWQCLGTYTYEQAHILFIILSKYEVHRLRNIVHKYDPQAFIVINEGVYVDGHYLKKL
jgi:uncharacterized membrane-anchored protein YitT (DUF2179 family)